jgi:hypothetical protein
MAISIPVISDFNSKGIDSAIREFKKLETAGEKAQFAIKKAAVPAAAALAGLGIVAVDAVKAFMEDDKAAQLLATSLRNTTGATDAQIASVEKFITQTSIAAAVADDELRPAFDKLVRGTGDITKAQDLMNLALNISAGTGKDLGAVSDALSKAFNGQLGPLKKLDPALAGLIANGATADEVFAALGDTFKGAASTSANTASGKMKSFSIQMGEFKESVGAAVFPIVDKLLPAFKSVADFVTNNTTLVITLGAVVGGLAVAIIAVNAATTAWAATTKAAAAIQAAFNAIMAANPIFLIGAAIVAVIAILVLLQKEFGIFDGVIRFVGEAFSAVWGAIKSVFDWVKNNWPLILAVITGPFGLAIAFVVKFKDDIMGIFSLIYNGIKSAMGFVAGVITAPFKAAFNAIAGLWNSTIGKLSFSVPSWVPGLGGKGFDVPDIPMLAEGGIVTGPTLAMIGEAGPEAVIPLSKMGGMGGMGGGITVNVNGGISTSQEISQAIVRALQNYVYQSGPVPINTRSM